MHTTFRVLRSTVSKIQKRKNKDKQQSLGQRAGKFIFLLKQTAYSRNRKKRDVQTYN